MIAYADAARSLGLDPYHMLRRAGLPVAALDERDHRIPADRVQRLIADSARAASCEEFGLLVGAAFRISMKGPLGLLLREQPTVGKAADALRAYLRYEHDAIEVRLEPADDGEMVIPVLLSSSMRASRAMNELTVAMYVQVFRDLLGPGWAPARVCFAHAAPPDIAPYQRRLGAVEFYAGLNGFQLTAADLATPLLRSDPGLAREIARFIEASAAPGAVTTVERVSTLIQRLMPRGECGVDEVARHLGVDRRTVHRRLAAEGASFTKLLERVRREAAADMLRHSDQPLGELTARLGFSSLSAFSRWFRSAYGIQPSEFRRLAHHN
jgi:AraC-like DNA-binding protein